jgi:L,D-peptidoglycan transpeptidase YkuD (ErfK/YbiS/YcfS/YnhG family)
VSGPRNRPRRGGGCGILGTVTPPLLTRAPGQALLAAALLLASGCGQGAGRDPGPAMGAPTGAETSSGRAAGPAAGPTAAASAGAARVPRQRQLITVTAASYGATYATLTAYRSSRHGWQRVFGPWVARIGRNGFAPPGGKREGDGRTPSGSFSMPFFFGVLPNPGVRFPYRRIRPYDYWDDDPASARYNLWVDGQRASPGASPEPMDVPAYDYGIDIGYNTARTPGLGSAIFLHLNIGIATAGCVTLPPGELLPLMRWLDPARSPRIRMGVG